MADCQTPQNEREWRRFTPACRRLRMRCFSSSWLAALRFTSDEKHRIHCLPPIAQDPYLRGSLNRLDDKLACNVGIVPVANLDPLARFEVLVVLKKMLYLLTSNLR